jgi:hypothetical protein
VRACAVALVLVACHAEPSSATLLSDVKTTLAQRELKLQAWAFKAHVQPGGDAYALAFRAPKSTRLQLPNGVLSFDGQTFFERDDAAKTLTVHPSSLSQTELALLWSTSFGARVPEGFRAPLLPSQGVIARRVGDTVELEWRSRDGQNDVTVTSVLRWPGGDFLERRTAYAGARGVVRMQREQCDARLSLCVPTQLARFEADKEVESTVLDGVQLGSLVSESEFVLTAPAGYVRTEAALR